MGIHINRRACARLIAAIVAVLACTATGAAATATPARRRARAVCDQATSAVRCQAAVRTTDTGRPMITSGPGGMRPADIKEAYGFPTGGAAGAGRSIALVTAFDAPTIAKDLARFSSAMGLPPCTVASGCFRKVDQSGRKHYPRRSPGWALEASLDVEWAHAIAPGAHLVLVEAKNAAVGNLMKAVDYAKTHATYVSMSWDSGEYTSETASDAHFVAPGVSFFAAAGDSGASHGALYPSASPNVVSVGGTSLTGQLLHNVFSYDETGWTGGGGGCSAVEAASPAQASYGAACGASRATPDVALDADPMTGASVFDSTRFHGRHGWFVVGGTSLATPMFAARSADLGTVVDASTIYGSALHFHDVTQGDNGVSCAVGYEMCTGRGSWSG
jgi:subtilase family serine protease